MKIIIFGSTGMLGSSILIEFAKHINFEIIATYKDKTKINLLKKKLKNNKKNIKFIYFDDLKASEKKIKSILKDKTIIVNCIGLIKQKIIDISDYDMAIKLNSIFPKKINYLRDKNKTKVYQIATDCVFDGKKGNYVEDDFHNFNDIYGLSKSCGEIIDKNFFNIRCSVIGKELNTNLSLYNWFLSLKNGTKVKGYSNHLWNGVTTAVFSKILATILIHNIKIPNLIHLIPLETISKFDILRTIQKMKDKKVKLIKFNPQVRINRVLNTQHHKINNLIWNKAFKKKLRIRDMIKNYI